MMHKKKIFFYSFCWLFNIVCFSQEAPNFSVNGLSPNATKSSNNLDVPVNYFTGMPNISVPIYSYSGGANGLALKVALSYNPGGIRVNESATSCGLGWSLEAGGMVARTLRGLPDETENNGYLHSPSIPEDFRANAANYYSDTIDAEADIFQYSCPGGSGKFMFGKNGSIISIPHSKVIIQPMFLSNNTMLYGFRVITEDGVKYDFKLMSASFFSVAGAWGANPTNGFSKDYISSWHLTSIISAFNTDTITFHYDEINNLFSGLRPPQIVYQDVINGDKQPVIWQNGVQSYSEKNIKLIELPNKVSISFLYSKIIKASGQNPVLDKIKICDTVFRFGYLLDYLQKIKTPIPGRPNVFTETEIKPLLKAVIPYTQYEKQSGYAFSYYSSPNYFPKEGIVADTLGNKRDYWGYFNSKGNHNYAPNVYDDEIPKIGNNIWGAERDIDIVYAKVGSLSQVTLPNGGHTVYSYESNSHYPYLKSPQWRQFNVTAGANTVISLQQIVNNKHKLNFFFDKSFLRISNTLPFSSSSILECAIKSTSGTITYATKNIPLSILYYQGFASWLFNLPSGNYLLEVKAATGINTNFSVDVEWENKVEDVNKTQTITGGLRVKAIMQFTGEDADIPANMQLFNYVTETGKSSGILGDVPNYVYPFKRYTTNGTLISKDYNVYYSEPLDDLDNVQGSHVGYARVEVLKTNGFLDPGLSNSINGKTVFDFTTFEDVNADPATATFPFIPKDIRNWGLGLVKRVSIYDSLGTLVKRTVNNYTIDTTVYNSANFKSLKLGHSGSHYGASTGNTPQKIFIGEPYYPTSGRVSLTTTTDSIYHLNGSLSTSAEMYEYDYNYNLKKITQVYDKARGLSLEQINYYPYDYTINTGAINNMKDNNIISPVISTESWIIGDNNRRLLKANITDFKILSNGIIKPNILYALESTKPVAENVIGNFNAGSLVRNTTYFKPQTQFNIYDIKANPLQITDLVTGISTSTIADYNNQYPIAKVDNALVTDIAYTSFESDGLGNWVISSNQRNITNAITGKKSYDLVNGAISKNGLNTSQTYLITFWAPTSSSITVTGNGNSQTFTPASAVASNNGWHLYQYKLTNAASVIITGTGLIDELRLHPNNANMVTTTYEPIIGETSINDANNNIVYKEYDNLNRIKLIRNKDKNIVKRFDYSDTVMAIITTPIWVYHDSICNNGYYKIIHIDSNFYSDSVGFTKEVASGLNCGCTTDPKFAVINGVCEIGNACNYSSVVKKINTINEETGQQTQEWVWECTYRYLFSNGTLSEYSWVQRSPYNKSNPRLTPCPCPMTCLMEDL
jgi:hypothetical protein